ncbi:MAG: pentapeptide repeat-containing protein [Pseudomonadota bacterium]
MQHDALPKARLRFSQKDLDAVLDRHERFLRGQPDGARALVKMADLSGLDLSRRNLSGMDFTGALMRNCYLVQAKLVAATGYACDLSGADLRGADMTRIDLRGANLRGSNLAFAQLDEADFRPAAMNLVGQYAGLLPTSDQKADADGACFRGASLAMADMTDMSARNADFRDSNLSDASLERANFKDCDFRGASLAGVRITGADLRGAQLGGCVLSGVRLDLLARCGAKQPDDAILDPPTTATAALEDIAARVADHRAWIDSAGAAGVPLDLRHADLRPAADAFCYAKLTAARLGRVIGIDLDFCGAELQGADFSGADLRGARFRDADLRGANFKAANLVRADFRNACLTPLVLLDGRSRAVRFDGAQLRYARFDGAKTPDDFDLPAEAFPD